MIHNLASGVPDLGRQPAVGLDLSTGLFWPIGCSRSRSPNFGGDWARGMKTINVYWGTGGGTAAAAVRFSNHGELQSTVNESVGSTEVRFQLLGNCIQSETKCV